MSEHPPTLSQWGKLYVQSLQFRQLACWTWMTEDRTFGIQDPKTGQIGYCCVIGSLGEVFGLIVYLGTEGLKGFRKLRDGKTDPGSFNDLLLQNCLSLTFESRECIQKKDQDIIKQLGLKFRGRNAYPLFRNFKPGYLPWFLTADESEYLTLALAQAAHVCMRYKEQTSLLDAPASGQYLVRTPVKSTDSITWQDRWRKPEPADPESLPVHVDELRVQKLRSLELKKQGVWEFDYAFAEVPIKETGRPYFPCFLIAADNATGFVFHTHIAAPDVYPSQFVNSFIASLEKTGFLPMEILVARDEAAAILEPVTARLGIKLTKVKTCKEANRARREFVKFMERR